MPFHFQNRIVERMTTMDTFPPKGREQVLQRKRQHGLTVFRKEEIKKVKGVKSVLERSSSSPKVGGLNPVLPTVHTVVSSIKTLNPPCLQTKSGGL